MEFINVILKIEITDRMYQDKLASLKDQLVQLEKGVHPEFLRKIQRLEQIYEDRIILDEAFLCFEVKFLYKIKL